MTDDQGTVTFGTEFVENWQEIEANLVLSKLWRGKVRKLTNVFSFTGKIRKRIQSNADRNRGKAWATFLIEVGNNNMDRFSYSPLGSGYPMIADFKGLDRSNGKCAITFLDSEFQSDILSGEKEKINLTTKVGLKGDEVTDYTTLLKTIEMHDRTLELNSAFDGTPEIKEVAADPTVGQVIAPFFNVNFKSDDDVKQTGSLPSDNENSADLFFLFEVEENQTYNIDYDILFEVTGKGEPTISKGLGVKLFKRAIDINGDEKFNTEIQTEIWQTDIEGEAYTFTYVDSESISLDKGDSLQICLLIERGVSSVDPITVRYPAAPQSDNIITIQSVDLYNKTQSKCLLPHEAFTHYIEIITGKKNAFYSTYFGRTDILDEFGNQIYEEDGEGAYIAVLDGHMIRNLPIEDNPFNTSLKDLIQNFIKLKRLVAEVVFVGDKEVVRIEKDEVVFPQDVIYDLGELTNNVEFKANKDLTYGSIKVGYPDIKLEDLNGLTQAHGELNYSLSNSIDNALDLMLTYLASDYLIEQIRRLQYKDDPTLDAKNDKKIFLIDAKPWTGDDVDLVAKRDEDYESVTGILSPGTSYNLALTPANIVRSWASVFGACLVNSGGNYIEGEYLILTKSASNNQLVTKKVDEDEVAEGANILTTTLQTPLLLNEDIIIGDAPVNKELWDLIEENPHAILSAKNKNATLYGRLNIAGYRSGESKGSFTLNRSNR
jgi:hypothetical protein